MIVPTGYIALRYTAATLAALLTCAVIRYSKRPGSLLIIAVCSITLPPVETVGGSAFAWGYIAALLFWLVRSVGLSIQRYREVVTSISALSVKDAVDSLHTGILFSEPEGFIVLVNVQMQKLMAATTGRVYRNSLYFYELLASGKLLPGCRKTEYEGQIVCLLPDKTAWVFTRTEMQIRNKLYFQFTATDITQRWALTAELQRQEELLLLRSEELRQMIADLHALSQTRELQNAKIRAHGVLGQRLTLLLHSVNSGQTPDYPLLRTQLKNLLADLKSGQNVASPQDKLDSLQQTFKTIGVEIHLDGSIPDKDTAGHIFVDIIDEGVVNAVRHGFASKVYIKSGYFNGAWHLEITDNGNVHSPSRPIREGGGIGGVRDKLEARGGSLTVNNYPRFTLRALLPEGKTDA
jgi:hypothetical protein